MGSFDFVRISHFRLFSELNQEEKGLSLTVNTKEVKALKIYKPIHFYLYTHISSLDSTAYIGKLFRIKSVLSVHTLSLIKIFALGLSLWSV